MTFKFGFFIGNTLYGWHNKHLYRLPCDTGKRKLPLKRLNIIDISGFEGYRVARNKKTIEQCKAMTYEFEEHIDIFCPNEDIP